MTAAAAHANASGYRATYMASPTSIQGTRTVNVALAGNSAVSASAQYVVPAADARGALGIAGLYLELTIGNSSTTLRRLSGPILGINKTPLTPTTADFAATRQFLNGGTTVAFEPGSPTSSVNADDMVGFMLSSRPLFEAIGQDMGDAIVVGAQAMPYSGALGLMCEALAAGTDRQGTAPEYMRVAIMTEWVDDAGLERRFDIVPQLNLCVVVNSDAAAAFATTMLATVPLSLREGLILSSSAATVLADAPLQYLPPYTGSGGLANFSDDDFARWAGVFDQYESWHRLIPTDPSKNAMWIVDPGTGTTVAVYVNGTGGGSECDNATLISQVQLAVELLMTIIAVRALSCEEGLSGLSVCLGLYVALGLRRRWRSSW